MMKKNLFLVSIIFLLVIVQIKAQETSTIIIRGELVEDAYINVVNYSPNPKSQTLIQSRWTHNGYEGVGRSLVKFDLSEIPTYAIIENSTLSLYHDPTSNHIGHSNLGGDNTGAIIRIIEEWADDEVIWENQPRTTNTNRVLIHPPETDDEDYPNLNTTEMVQDLVNHPETGNGLMIKLHDEDALYRSLVFASTDNQDAGLWPTLTVNYSTEITFDTIVKLKHDAEKGKDVYINSVYSDPDGERVSLIAAVWNYTQGYGIGRGLIDFDLSSIGYALDVQKAELNLYKNPVSGHQGHSKIGGDNHSIIKRITEPWDEYSVTWFNQPEATDENQVEVNTSDISDQDFLSIDVTELVLDMIANPAEAHGFQLRLAEEIQAYRSIVFASSDHPDSTLWPSLNLYCSVITADIEVTRIEVDFKIYPNPGSGLFSVNVEKSLEDAVLYVLDARGKVLVNQELNNNTTSFDLSGYPKGIYFVRLINKGIASSQKLVVQ